MRRLAQLLRSKWEEIIVTGIWIPLVLAAVSTTDPVMIIVSFVGGGASLFGLYSLIDKLSQRRRLPTFGGEASKIPRGGILFTVGLQTGTVDYAIKGQKPGYLAFLCTEESLPVLDKLIAQNASREGQWRREIADARDVTGSSPLHRGPGVWS